MPGRRTRSSSAASSPVPPAAVPALLPEPHPGMAGPPEGILNAQALAEAIDRCVAARMATAEARPPPAPTSTPFSAEGTWPDKFDVERDDLRDWLEDMEESAAALHASEQFLIKMTRRKLDDHHRALLHAHSRRDSWATVKRTLLSADLAPSRRKELLHLLGERKRGSQESLAVFGQAVQQLADRAYQGQSAEVRTSHALAAFVRGLSNYLGRKVLEGNCNTIEEAVDRALRYEDSDGGSKGDRGRLQMEAELAHFSKAGQDLLSDMRASQRQATALVPTRGNRGRKEKVRRLRPYPGQHDRRGPANALPREPAAIAPVRQSNHSRLTPAAGPVGPPPLAVPVFDASRPPPPLPPRGPLCWICQQPGHMARQCPLNSRR